MHSSPWQTWLALSLLLVARAGFADEPERGRDTESTARPVNPNTLQRKVLCGYQGWFRCAGDEANEGWQHWSRDSRRIRPESLTVEMWPDLSEFDADERYPAGSFRHARGKQAELFSSVNTKTVDRHFAWMRQYGLDGVFLQRFLVEAQRPSTGTVLRHVRQSAQQHGRVWALCYDLSGHRPEQIVERLKSDWQHLVDELKITQDQQYLHHNGKPVLFVWGFYSDRFEPAIANQIVDLFHQDDPYQATLIGGCQWYWRTEKNAEWAKVFRRFDVLSPWNVGNTTLERARTVANPRGEPRQQAATGYWRDDLAETKRAGIGYLPVIYPGFGWTNLKGADASRHTIPRLGGEFFWRQFRAAADLEIDMAYVAMFDEVDEATAIFKVTNDPPQQAHFQTYEGLPSDWYLRLTAAGAQVIRGEIPASRELPLKP
jgi:hypothetical protein